MCRKRSPLKSQTVWTTLLLSSPSPPLVSSATWDVHHFSLHQTSPLKSAAGCDSFFALTPASFPQTSVCTQYFLLLFWCVAVFVFSIYKNMYKKETNTNKMKRNKQKPEPTTVSQLQVASSEVHHPQGMTVQEIFDTE